MSTSAALNSQPLGAAIRGLFPLWGSAERRTPAFLDSAASSQKPSVVIDRISRYLGHEHANIHRGAYKLSSHATELYEAARKITARFINAASSSEIIFTRGTTEAINLAAYSLGESIKPGDFILLTLLEHHSNIVPWQIMAERKQAKIVFADLEPDGSLNLDSFYSLLKKHRPKVAAMTQTANAIGALPPVKEMAAAAHKEGAIVLVDAAQSAPHSIVDVQDIGADLLAFSGHKVYGPTGIGVLYGRRELLDVMPPFMGGGDMIETVSTSGSTWAKVPQKFEAGTPPIAEAIGLGAALEFMMDIGRERIAQHEHALLKKSFEMLSSEPGVTIYGPIAAGKPHGALLTFNVNGVHPHDLATIADSVGAQIRSGHHCAQTLLNRLGLNSTARLSFGVYSDNSDLEILIESVRRAKKIFAKN